jgi:hypothetical protein
MIWISDVLHCSLAQRCPQEYFFWGGGILLKIKIYYENKRASPACMGAPMGQLCPQKINLSDKNCLISQKKKQLNSNIFIAEEDPGFPGFLVKTELIDDDDDADLEPIQNVQVRPHYSDHLNAKLIVMVFQ